MTFEADDQVYGMTHLYQKYDEIVSLHSYQVFCQQTFRHTPINNLILGHTHRQAVRYLSDTIKWLNPGSVSYRRPDDPDQTAHYATIKDGEIFLHRLVYDLAPVRFAVRQVALKESEMSAAERFFAPREHQDSPLA
jgi:predicted phosphodiesterase